MRACKICEKGKLVTVEDIIMEVEGYVFVAKGERCDGCKEEFPYEEETNRMIAAARRMGIWPEPLKLHRHLSKSAGGLVLRIPGDIEKQLDLKESAPIAISKVGSKIVIETDIN